MRLNFLLVIFSLTLAPGINSHAQTFIHPGIDQTAADLEFMRAQVRKGEQPWKDAFGRLQSETDLNFEIRPFAHVMRGPYGRPNIGGNDLSKGASMAYNCALIWYITDEKKYARNAYFGILVTESRNISISGNFIEGNDRSGVMMEFLYRGSEDINVINNQIQFNNGFGVEAYAAQSSKVSNKYAGNKLSEEKISDEKYIIMK